MKHFSFWAFALLIMAGLSSCSTLTYQHCEAYNGVAFATSETPSTEAEVCQE